MKKNCWLILGVLLAANLFAQTATNVPPTKAETKPAAKTTKATKKKAPAPAAEKKPAAIEPLISLSPGAAIVHGYNVNVRGKASFVGEVITRLNNGDPVTVIEQIILQKPKADEPSQWAKIVFPTNASVWVHTSYIDGTNKTVLPKKLNVRSGPGENYSIVGIIERGTPVKELLVKDNWMKIEPASSAYAFVAAKYLQQAESKATVPAVVSIAPPIPEPAAAPVAEPPAISAPPTTAPTAASTTPPEPSPLPQPDAANAEPPPAVIEEPLPPRIVSHEGVVRTTLSIQAPTKYEIWDPRSRQSINYLYSPSTNLNVARWNGLRVIVTGEEGLDERWKKTPVITIQRIQVVQ